MSKYVVYKALGAYYLTDAENYGARIQNARKTTRLDGVTTHEQAEQMISKFCGWYHDKKEDYRIID